MTAEKEYSFPDHGDPKDWATLDAEEDRCQQGLIAYYTKIEEKPSDVAAELAWKDLKKEHKRLASFKWYS